MTRIILVRHCEAQGNTLGLFQGHTDSEVSGNGAVQLELLALRLRNRRLDAIYSSPLKRALRTAEAINRYHGLAVRIDPGLIEINGGALEGKPWGELPKLYPEEMGRWYERPQDFAAPGGESMRAVYERVWASVSGIVRENSGKTVCVASHGCAIRNFLCRALRKPIERLNDVPWCDNTAVSVIDFDEKGGSTVIMMNDASHLTPGVSVFRKQSWWKEKACGDAGEGKR